MFHKEAKSTQWEKQHFLEMVLVKQDFLHLKIQVDFYLLPCTNLKSMWIKDLNIKPEPLNLIEERVGSSFEHISIGNNFLNKTLLV